MPLSDDIRALCRTLGFANAGIATIEPSRWAAELKAWLGAGKHGSMSYLDRNLELRLDPARLLPGAKSAIMVADLYTDRHNSTDPPLPEGHGRIARYARGRDYHTVLKERLHTLADRLREQHPGHDFRTFTDTAPILERELAHRAGLGWIGKHTLLIHPRLGSYFFLGGLLTTLDLVASPAPQAGAQGPLAPQQGRSPFVAPSLRRSVASPAIPDHCGTCTRCIDACPTQAITPYSVNASRCMSYLTIEHRAEIPVEFHTPIADNLFGCDICQEVCPHNSPRPLPQRTPTVREGPETRVPIPADPNPAYTSRLTSLPLLDLLSWTPTDRSRAFQSSALKRATLPMIKRNALIAAANHLRTRRDPALDARMTQIAADASEPELVRTTASDVLTQLRDMQARA